ncbi:putative ABC transporter permease [Limosilactobacillus sp.]|uniref:putative ABC transporter permease n=1 Tax=Limosilactobacillus sp. TaxID=2773925 RepID=UPI003F0DCE62
MPYTISELVVFFFTYSVIGWLWETVYCSIKDHHYAYRGFLFGPYCPVYGFAITTILVTTYRVRNNLFWLFVVGMIVASLFEYFASLFLEKVFHMKLWDYSQLWGNLQGRIAPAISLFWGIGVVLLVHFIQPFVQEVINWEEMWTHGFLALFITVGMGTDTVMTVFSIRHFHMTTKQWDQRINAFQERLRQRLQAASEPEERALRRQQLADWRQSFIDRLEEGSSRRLNWNERRLIKSFPRMKVLDAKRFNQVKQDLLKK